MSRYEVSQRYLEQLVTATLEGEVVELRVVSAEDGKLKLSAWIYCDGSDPEETRIFLEELIEAELQGWTVQLDGPFISRQLPTNLVAKARAAAAFPEAIYQVMAPKSAQEGVYRIRVRHQEQFLGKKRNRIQKFYEDLDGIKVEVVPLGRQEQVALLNTLPKVHAFFEPFVQGVEGFSVHHIHTYKAYADRETLAIQHNSKADPRVLERLARRLTLLTDVLVQFDYRMSRAEARTAIETVFSKLNWVEGYHISFQEKGSNFVVTVDCEKTRMPELQQLTRTLQQQTSYKVEALIDIERDVMVARLIRSFPENGILTWMRNIDENLYEVEAHVPFDPANEALEKWSDLMEQQWGAKILFSEPYMRSPDFRFRNLRGSDAETIAVRYNRPKGFSPEALAVAEQMAQVDWERELSRRVDIRKTIVLSIDPERTKDIDDALSVEARPDGLFEVGVHIADVSAFVPQGSALDQEAMLRGFTTYLAVGEIPVIPPVLSDNVCSLHGQKDSLCMSVFMVLDEAGEMKDFRVERTIIHNYCRFAYAGAQRIIDGKDPEHPYAWQILTLHKLAQVMRAGRKDSGALDLSLEDDPEKPSHQLIEEFMLQANECVSRFLTREHPTRLCLFRTHPDVTESSLEALRELARHLRMSTRITDQKSMQQALEEVLHTPKFDIFRYHLGRVLDKAIYHVEQLGHGALAKEDYAHFTSPIRRYTDLIIHRLIEDCFYKEERGGAACYEKEDLQGIADHLNRMEIRVDAASFESHRLNELQMYDGMRRQYTGRILSFMRGRMAIKLDQTDLMVNVRYKDLKAEKMMPITIMDELTDRYFTLGDEVQVRTEGVDWSMKSINAKVVR